MTILVVLSPGLGTYTSTHIHTHTVYIGVHRYSPLFLNDHTRTSIKKRKKERKKKRFTMTYNMVQGFTQSFCTIYDKE